MSDKQLPLPITTFLKLSALPIDNKHKALVSLANGKPFAYYEPMKKCIALAVNENATLTELKKVIQASSNDPSRIENNILGLKSFMKWKTKNNPTFIEKPLKKLYKLDGCIVSIKIDTDFACLCPNAWCTRHLSWAWA